MKGSVAAFYDSLSRDYHLIFHDWTKAVTRQGAVLSKMIHSKLPGSLKGVTLLDCSCGIGTQAIGLAKYGFTVTATDLSAASVERAKKEAESLGVAINFGVADFRSLESDVPGTFDVVLSADNAIPHLLTDEDLHAAARNLYAKTNDNGVLLITIRDYDTLLKEKQRATVPQVFDNGRRIVFQVWDWADDTSIYTTNHFILLETNGEWITTQHQTKYRALLRDELSQVIKNAGFIDAEWHMPEKTGFYQPILTAIRDA